MVLDLLVWQSRVVPGRRKATVIGSSFKFSTDSGAIIALLVAGAVTFKFSAYCSSKFALLGQFHCFDDALTVSGS